MNKRKLAVFDLDGTLFDTGRVNFEAYKEAVEKYGRQINIDNKFFSKYCNGNSCYEFLPCIMPDVTKEQIQCIHEYKKQIYQKYLDAAIKNEHLFWMIPLIRQKYQTAIATTASRKNAEELLNYFGVMEWFDFIIAQEDVKETKPSPECFLLAMKQAEASCKDTIIFEDSKPGLIAAKASGANYMQIYWQHEILADSLLESW